MMVYLHLVTSCVFITWIAIHLGMYISFTFVNEPEIVCMKSQPELEIATSFSSLLWCVFDYKHIIKKKKMQG